MNVNYRRSHNSISFFLGSSPETADDCVVAVVGLLVVLVGFGLGVLVGFVTGFVVDVGLGLTVV